MDHSGNGNKQRADRRSFLKTGALGAGAAVGAGLLLNNSSAFGHETQGGRLTEGDAAILQLLLAAEIIETDLWKQYRELEGSRQPAESASPTSMPFNNWTAICRNTFPIILTTR